jgi:hypothetical protein
MTKEIYYNRLMHIYDNYIYKNTLTDSFIKSVVRITKEYIKYEELEKENQELKEQHEKDFEIICKQAYLLNNKHIDSPFIEKYQKAIDILKIQISLEKIQCENGYIYIVHIGDIPVLINQQEFELLNGVLDNGL